MGKGKNGLPFGALAKAKDSNSVIAPTTKMGRPEIWTEEVLEKEILALFDWLNASEDNYYVCEFAETRGYPPQWLDGFATKSPTFSLALSRARSIMERRIVKGSMDRTYDGNFAKFVLANKAGWRERQEISGSKDDPLSNILINIDGRTKEIVEDVEGEQVK